MSKIIGLTKSAAKEVASQNIRVNCIAPYAFHQPSLSHLQSLSFLTSPRGTVDTPMLGAGSGKSRETLMQEIRGHTPLARMGTTDELSKSVAFLLDNEQSSFITGAVLPVDGGMSA